MYTFLLIICVYLSMRTLLKVKLNPFSTCIILKDYEKFEIKNELYMKNYFV
jgi:hypothetical protein